MNSKEEILKKWMDKDISYSEAASGAMDEYRSQGEQEMAIKFGMWLIKNKFQPVQDKWWDSYIGSEYKTTEQLYELFKQSL